MDLELFEILEYVERETQGEMLDGLVEPLESRTEIERWVGET